MPPITMDGQSGPAERVVLDAVSQVVRDYCPAATGTFQTEFLSNSR